MLIPELETSRLRLRGHTLDDFPRMALLWADVSVTRYIGGKPNTAEEAWGRLLRYAGHWAMLGFGYWVVEEKTTGIFLGEAGFADYRRDLDPPFGDTPEAGWVFAPIAQGKGYAFEAVNAIHDWGRTHFQTAQSACIIHPDNTPSLRLAAKVGYRETACVPFKDKPTVVLHRDW